MTGSANSLREIRARAEAILDPERWADSASGDAPHDVVALADDVAALLELVTAVAAMSPWTGSYDNDWCHFCYAQPENYGSKPWRGHRPDCLWVRIAGRADLAVGESASQGFEGASSDET